MAVTVVTGPPAAGKSTWVSERAGSDDLVIDLDQIAGSHHRTAAQTHSAWVKVQELEAQARTHPGDVWVIRCAPRPGDRAELAERVGADRVVVLPVDAETAKARASASKRPGLWPALIDKWWDEYRPAEFDEVVPAMGSTEGQAAMADDTTTDAPADDVPAPTTPPDPPPAPAAKPQEDGLGDGGKAALEAERKARRAADKALKDAQAELDQFRQATMSETEKAIANAKAEGRKEALTEATNRLARSELRAVAAGKLADPDDAAALIGDLSEFVTADGDINTKAMTSAIDALVKAKPYLAPQTAKPAPLPGGGATPSNGFSMDDFIRQQARGR